MVQTYAQRHIAEPQRKKRRKAAASRSADADGTDEPVSTAITTTTSLARARPRHSPLAAGYVQSPAAAGEAEPAPEQRCAGRGARAVTRHRMLRNRARRQIPAAVRACENAPLNEPSFAQAPCMRRAAER